MMVAGKRKIDDAVEKKGALEGEIMELRQKMMDLQDEARKARERRFLTGVFRPRPTPFPLDYGLPKDGLPEYDGDEADIETEQYPGPDYEAPMDIPEVSPPPPETPTPAPIPNWQLFWIRLWRIAFRVPKRMGQWEPPPEYDPDSEMRLIGVEAKVQAKMQLLEKYSALANLHNIDLALIAMFDEEFVVGPYKMNFFRWIKNQGTSLGNYDSVINNSMLFRHGTYCNIVKRGRETLVNFVCFDESKLVKVTEISTCRYVGVFATPAGCNPDAMDSLRGASLDYLESIADQLDLERTD
jgi:hypothetical protein